MKKQKQVKSVGKSKILWIRSRREEFRRRVELGLEDIWNRLRFFWLRFRHYGDIRELLWDRRLRIKTTGRDERHAGKNRHAYEPTPYLVLKRIADAGYIRKQDVLLDYGCGKGRVDFFFSFVTGCRSIGIEYDREILKIAKKNQRSFSKRAMKRVCFLEKDALDYDVPASVNRIFFFNPFSQRLLKKVLEKVLASYLENPREIILFFYYPTVEYMELLLSMDELELLGEIETKDLYPPDPQEAVMAFRLFLS